MTTITNITYPVVALFAFACFALSPQARAVCQQGCDTSLANTFLGDDALVNNTIGTGNTAIGFDSLNDNTTGTGDTAIGAGVLEFNTTGGSNTAIGLAALSGNTAGSNNTANGFDALFTNTTASDNTADGAFALLNNTTGNSNVANGFNALLSNTTGSFNAVNGVGALKVSNGSNNTADGYRALFKNTTGNNNIAVGSTAGSNLTTGSNNIDIGALGVAGEANTMRLGVNGTQTNTYIAGVSGVTVAGGVGVIVDSSGHMGTIVSSKRFKENIEPMDKNSEAIFSLQPVTFRYKHDLDPDSIPQFGLVAEDVEKINPALVARDDKGKPYSVRYEAVNAMLLNEFLKEHHKVEEQGAMIARQQKQIEALAASLQKVSAQLELSKAAPKTVLNNR